MVGTCRHLVWGALGEHVLVLTGRGDERGQLGEVLVDLVGAVCCADLGVQVQLLALLMIVMRNLMMLLELLLMVGAVVMVLSSLGVVVDVKVDELRGD